MYISLHTLKVLLHYLAKHKRLKLSKFCCTQRNDTCLMITKLTNMIGKINYSLYGVKLNAQSFMLSHIDDTLLKTMPDINQSVHRHHDLADLLLHFPHLCHQ